MITRWKHLFCVSSCVAASGGQKQLDMFFVRVDKKKKNPPDVQRFSSSCLPGWFGARAERHVWVVSDSNESNCTWRLHCFFYAAYHRSTRFPNTFFHLPPFPANFIYTDMTFFSQGLSDALLYCYWMRHTNITMSRCWQRTPASDGQFTSERHTDRLWLNDAPARRQALLFIALSECSRRNHFTICPSVWPLIPLSCYSDPGSVWIVRAVLRPPWPWNIVCRVIPMWAEHSGSVFPICYFFYLFIFLASLAGVLIAQYAIVI